MTTKSSDKPDAVEPEELPEEVQAIVDRYRPRFASWEDLVRIGRRLLDAGDPAVESIHEVAVLVAVIRELQAKLAVAEESLNQAVRNAQEHDARILSKLGEMGESIERIEEIIKADDGAVYMMRAFFDFRNDVDNDGNVLDTYDLALGYFVGLGLPVGAAQNLAAVAQSRVVTIAGSES